MNILWACVFVTLGNVTLIEVTKTREHCEHIRDQHLGSTCYPVTVSNKTAVEEQIKAINTVIK